MTPQDPTRQFFFCKLIAPRPTFQADMTDSERTVMLEHVAYWTALAEKGVAVVFGPVFDPAGGYGIGVVEEVDQAAVEVLRDEDPVVRSGIGLRYEIYPMRVGAIRK